MSLHSQYVIGLYRDVKPTKTDVATISCAHWVCTSFTEHEAATEVHLEPP